MADFPWGVSIEYKLFDKKLLMWYVNIVMWWGNIDVNNTVSQWLSSEKVPWLSHNALLPTEYFVQMIMVFTGKTYYTSLQILMDNVVQVVMRVVSGKIYPKYNTGYDF